jgi:hypothetical protein
MAQLGSYQHRPDWHISNLAMDVGSPDKKNTVRQKSQSRLMVASIGLI